jgi:hypothetical protein
MAGVLPWVLIGVGVLLVLVLSILKVRRWW